MGDSWSPCLILKDSSSLRPSSLGRCLDYFLCFFLAVAGHCAAPWAVGRQGGRGAWNKGWGCVVQRTALNLHSEAVQQAVLGTPPSPWSWILLFLTSDWFPSTVLICAESLSAFLFHSQDVTFSSSLTWPRLDQLSLSSTYLASPWREACLASSELYLTSVVCVMCSTSCCIAVTAYSINIFYQKKVPRERQHFEFKVVHGQWAISKRHLVRPVNPLFSRRPSCSTYVLSPPKNPLQRKGNGG